MKCVIITPSLNFKIRNTMIKITRKKGTSKFFLTLFMLKNVLKTNLFVVNNNLYGFFLFCEEENPQIIILYDDTLAETNKLTFVISQSEVLICHNHHFQRLWLSGLIMDNFLLS